MAASADTPRKLGFGTGTHSGDVGMTDESYNNLRVSPLSPAIGVGAECMWANDTPHKLDVLKGLEASP